MTKIKTVLYKTRIRLGLVYLLFWLVPGAIAFCAHIFVRPDYIRFGTSAFGGLSNLFGPWATVIVKMSDFPNAGEFFNLSYALIHTAALAAVVIISITSREKWVRVCCVALFVPLILWWLWVGFIQLASCAT